MAKTLIAKGKTKHVYADENPDFVILEAIDQLTAGDAAKLAKIDSIGAEKTAQTANIFRAFEAAGIKTAFVDKPSAIELRCHAVEMLPLEMVMRRFAYGSFLKRNLALDAGHRFDEPLTEIFHKSAVIMPPLVDMPMQISENKARELYLKDRGWEKGVYTDPYVRAEGEEWAIFDAKLPIEGEPLMRIQAELSAGVLEAIWDALLKPAFALLESKLKNEDIALADIKFEIGKRKDNCEYVIADVVDNDSWRIWPGGDPKAQLDKQGFREGAQLDEVLRNYKIVTKITENF